MTRTQADKFIPQMWSDEVVATYKSNLVAANLVRNLNHSGKKGDSIIIPKPNRKAAFAKAENTEVNTTLPTTATDVTVSIDQHFEWSMYIEDIAEMQALSSMRKFYTDDAGYALATNVDAAIITSLRAANTVAGETSNPKTELESITDWDVSILTGNQALNDNDAPQNGRSLIVSPSAYTALLKEERFTEQAFIGNGTAISTGKVGQIYGVDVFVSTAVGTGAPEKGIMFQQDALVLATQQSVRTQTQYKQEMLADLFTADTVYGMKVVRPESVVEMSSGTLN